MNRIRLVHPVNSCPNYLTDQALNDLITLLKSCAEVLRLVAAAASADDRCKLFNYLACRDFGSQIG